MRRKLHAPFLLIAVCLGALWITALAPAKMRSVKIVGGLCQTMGGHKIVPIPGFSGERIDRRILPDVRRLVKRYKVFIIDGYSNDPVHASSGEHPMGLAVDVVPDFAKGGSWHLVTKLAKRAEPVQNQPVAPYRWVGYNGDEGHGRGDHLHLSWSHSELTRNHRFPKTVISRACPTKHKSGHSGGDGNGGGGVSPTGGGSGSSGGTTGTGSGGVGLRVSGQQMKLAPAHPETAAESVR